MVNSDFNILDKICLKRSTAIALLVRLERQDIPYVQSRECRHQLIEYLSDTLITNGDEHNGSYVMVDVQDLGTYVTDLEMAVKILKNYAEYIREVPSVGLKNFSPR